MIINKMTCEQFAGVRDKDITLSDGLNILVGDNETGKSTMIDLIYNLFFQEPKISRKDSFLDLYFPKKASGNQGDAVDGELSFTTPSGTYKLKKEWEVAGGVSKMTTPDGAIIKNNDEINRILAQELKYGAGVYNEVIFGSQKRAMSVLQALFQNSSQKKAKGDKSADVKDEISAIVTKAVMETGGISIDKLEKQLSIILQQYDENWDFEANLPRDGRKRGIENKWSCATTKDENQAKILRSYYALKELEEEQRKARKAETDLEEANDKFTKAKKDSEKAVSDREIFLSYRDTLKNRSLLQNNVNNAKQALKQMTDDSAEWPKATERSKSAEELRSLLQQAQCKEKYEIIAPLQEEVKQKNEEIEQLADVDPDDIAEAVHLESDIQKKSARLQGLNIAAKIKQLDNFALEVRNTADGTTVPVTDGIFQITQAVDIRIPGLFEMQLMPVNVNADEIKETLSTDSRKLQMILDKYSAESVAKLQDKKRSKDDLVQEVSRIKEKVGIRLGETSWEELEEEYKRIPENIETVSEVNGRIKQLCGGSSLDGFIGGLSQKITQFEQKYENQDALSVAIEDKKKELNRVQGELDNPQAVPDEYKDITEVDAYDKKLQKSVEERNKNKDDLVKDLQDKELKLPQFSAEEYDDQITKKTAEFEKQKEEYKRYKHIAEVVKVVKAASMGNPMTDIEEKFGKYLGFLTDGDIALNSMNDRLDSAISSKNNKLSYEILSEGTKDTIALAFRLAVLEHLFPDGGGLAIFDDPFTDMDEKRKAQACKLVNEFAKHNQVLFVTCDREYADRLRGNIIEF